MHCDRTNRIVLRFLHCFILLIKFNSTCANPMFTSYVYSSRKSTDTLSQVVALRVCVQLKALRTLSDLQATCVRTKVSGNSANRPCYLPL